MANGEFEGPYEYVNGRCDHGHPVNKYGRCESMNRVCDHGHLLIGDTRQCNDLVGGARNDGPLEAPYKSRFEPVHPCRRMATRHCPAIYQKTCDEAGMVCARFESDNETPWLPEMP